MEHWYESSNNSRDLHISSIKKQKQAVLTPNRRNNLAKKEKEKTMMF